MIINLKGKTAIVSGSTAGIGHAIAQGLAEAGASVIVNGRTEQRVKQAVQKIKAAFPKADVKGLAADLGTNEGAQELIQQVPEADILINNLGIFEPKPFFDIPGSAFFGSTCSAASGWRGITRVAWWNVNGDA